eukprot:14827289-Alexandrium_andersonii.AAC.1
MQFADATEGNCVEPSGFRASSGKRLPHRGAGVAKAILKLHSAHPLDILGGPVAPRPLPTQTPKR